MELSERIAGHAARRPRPRATLRRGQGPDPRALIAELGPQLFNSEIDARGAASSRASTTSARGSAQERGLCARRSRAARRRDRRRHARPRPARAAARRRDRHRDHGQRAGRRLDRAQRPALRHHRALHRRRAPAPHHQQDRVARSGAASTRARRWSTPACPTAAASTRSSRRSRSRARCSRSASSPSARLDLEDMVRLGTLTPAGGRVPRRVRARRSSTSSSPAARAAARRRCSTRCRRRSPSSERIVTIEDAAELRLNQRHVLRLESRPRNIEGEGERPDPRARAQLAAHAPGPHHRRRGPRRRGAGHAPGDEHGPRRLAVHRARELAAATRSRASRRWC